MGQYQLALEDMDEALRIDPQLAHVYANRSLTNTLLGKDVEAQQDVDLAVRFGIDRGTLESAIGELKKQR